MLGRQWSELPPPPCISTNGGALSEPLIRMKVCPYEVLMVKVSDGTGHSLAFSSYSARNRSFAWGERNGW